jgi:phosphoserine phosphatase
LLYVHGDSGRHEILPVDTPPLGVVEALDVRPRDPMVMRPGDLFVALSDGFYEAVNPAGERFGMERLIELVVEHRRRSAAEILDAVREDVDAFADGQPADDDRTAIIIRRTR